jgi:putative phosphotransacetylase
MIAGVEHLERKQVETLVRQALRAQLAKGGGGTGGVPTLVRPKLSNAGPNPLMVNVSARHMHVTEGDLEILFGPGSKLTKLKDLYQEGEFASEQIVNLIGPKNRLIPAVRILGAVRKFTQIELSYTDGIFLGLDLPLRISGDIKGTAGCVVVGPHGALTMREGVIRAARHVHMSEADMKHFGVKDGDAMKLKVEGPCGVTFDNVKVRYHPKVKLEVHIDTDEGNACHLQSATRMELLR